MSLLSPGFAGRCSLWRKGVSFFGKKLHNIKRIQKLPERESSILRSPVRVKHKPIRSITFFISFFEGSHDQIHVWPGGNVPGNNFPGKQVHDNA